MKLFTCALVLLLNSTLFAQVDSTRSLSFFQLQEGNQWEYSVDVHPYHGLPYDDGFHTISVGPDTLMPNGHRYSSLQGVNFEYGSYDSTLVSYVRIDSTNLSVKYYSEWFSGDMCNNSETVFLDLGIEDSYAEYQTCLGTVDYWPDYEQDGIFGIVDTMQFHNYMYYQMIGLYPQIGLADLTFGDLGFSALSIHTALVNGIFYETVNVNERAASAPIDFRLRNYPNPFNSSTTFEITNMRGELLSLSIYNTLGEKVSLLYTGMGQGRKTLVWDAASSPSGVYFAVVKSESSSTASKLLLLK